MPGLMSKCRLKSPHDRSLPIILLHILQARTIRPNRVDKTPYSNVPLSNDNYVFPTETPDALSDFKPLIGTESHKTQFLMPCVKYT
jgi:hypothetical protein